MTRYLNETTYLLQGIKGVSTNKAVQFKVIKINGEYAGDGVETKFEWFPESQIVAKLTTPPGHPDYDPDCPDSLRVKEWILKQKGIIE